MKAMTKNQFIDLLKEELKHNNVPDAEDIIEEYEQHFSFKLADGYSEEEISAKLGDPKSLADQYDSAPAKQSKGKKALTFTLLGITDFFFGILCTLLIAWEVVMISLSLAFAAVSVCLIANLQNIFRTFTPTMPYHCSLILGLAFAALTILAVTGAIYFFGFIRQLMRSFTRFHKNKAASARSEATLPPIAVYPRFSAKFRRCLRTVSLISVSVFAVLFIAGFIVCIITSGDIQFWHTWHWFNYNP